METSTPPSYTQTYHYYSSASSPPPTADLRRFRHHQNVRLRPNLTMPLRDLTLRRIATNQNCFRFNQTTESFSIAKRYAPINHRAMAEERKNTDVSQEKASLSVSITAEEKDKSSDKSTPALSPPPPPPEKPLPGDCCGSGCVRCVWDVYYEELEEYNKLCDSKIS